MAAITRSMRLLRLQPQAAAAARVPLMMKGAVVAKRGLSSVEGGGALRHNAADAKIGIGYLQLTPEEMAAEHELLGVLPEFQEAIRVLHGDDEQFKVLPNTRKAALALPHLARTVEICRSAMGFNSVYLLAALRHLFLTQFMSGDYAAANRTMRERGELADWSMTEQERMLRLFFRQGRPQLGREWCHSAVFTGLFPEDATMPLKWTMYELLGRTLADGAGSLRLEDPLFTDAVDVLRDQKRRLTEAGAAAEDTLPSREVPYLMAQYGAMCLVASDALGKDAPELNDQQLVALHQAEALWREALTMVERSGHEETTDELVTGVDAPFEAWVQVNLGELLLRMKRNEEAMECLGKALQIQQRDKGGNALALNRVLSKIAQGCHALGQAVSGEGLFTSVVEAFEKEAALSPTDQVEYARVLRAYGDLLRDWDKRDKDAEHKYAKATEIERAIALRCEENQCRDPLHPVFYLPL